MCLRPIPSEDVGQATTRPMRPGERDDVDYHFVCDDEFDAMVDAGRIRRMGAGLRPSLRHAQSAGEGRVEGRPRHLVRHRLAGHPAVRAPIGEDLVTSSSCRRRWPSSTPPAARGTDSDDVIEASHARAATRSATGPNMSMSWSTTTPAMPCQVRAIVAAERLKRGRQSLVPSSAIWSPH